MLRADVASTAELSLARGVSVPPALGGALMQVSACTTAEGRGPAGGAGEWLCHLSKGDKILAFLFLSFIFLILAFFKNRF